jgi:AcrR family transcriptional regulator
MGINERKSREKESRIKQIRDSAAALFYKKGYAATTIENIATLTEISKATIYLYFRSKDDLYYSLVEPSLDRLSKRLIAIANMRNLIPKSESGMWSVPRMPSTKGTMMPTISYRDTRHQDSPSSFQRTNSAILRI